MADEKDYLISTRIELEGQEDIEIAVEISLDWVLHWTDLSVRKDLNRRNPEITADAISGDASAKRLFRNIAEESTLTANVPEWAKPRLQEMSDQYWNDDDDDFADDDELDSLLMRIYEERIRPQDRVISAGQHLATITN